MHKNPFAQSPQYWQVTFDTTSELAAVAQDALSDMCLSVSMFEADEAANIWSMELLFSDAPDMKELERCLMVLCKMQDAEVPEMTLGKTRQVDWLAEVARSFPPLRVGRFYIHGAHVEEAAPHGSIAIQVEAGAAFGSGEHGTTSGCLLALELLHRKMHAIKILDMGTGSGILAIAAAHLWHSPVLAVDVDPIAVQVTKDNIAINTVRQWVQADVSDGYKSKIVKDCAPYDIIIANILARPLVAFAAPMAKQLADGGYVILSGLLVSQEQYVLHAHQLQGLRLKKRFAREGWSTLLLQK